MSDPLSFHSPWPHYSPEPNTTYHLILIPLLECNFHSCCNCIFFSFLWYSYLCCICISAARYLIVANVGQTSFWHFCHDRNCNNQPQQHKRHNHKVVIICSLETKTYFCKTVRCRIHHNSLNSLTCASCNWTIWSVLSFLNIHYSFAGKVFFGQNKKNSCVLAVSSIYLLKDWGLAHQEKESGPLNFYLFYLKLWLAPFISPCTNVRAPKVRFQRWYETIPSSDCSAYCLETS